MDLSLRIRQGDLSVESDRNSAGNSFRRRDEFLTGSFTPIPLRKVSVTTTQQVFEVVVPNGATVTNLTGSAFVMSKFDPPSLSATLDGGLPFTSSQVVVGVSSLQSTPTTQAFSNEEEDDTDEALEAPIVATPADDPLPGLTARQSVSSPTVRVERPRDRRQQSLPRMTYSLSLSSGTVFMAFVDITVNGTRRIGYAIDIAP